MRSIVIGCAAAVLLSGCIARTALDVATSPVRVASGAVDMATTSQSEADERRGREMRKREERLGKLEWRYQAERESCDQGDNAACEAAGATYTEIQTLLPAGSESS